MSNKPIIPIFRADDVIKLAVASKNIGAEYHFGGNNGHDYEMCPFCGANSDRCPGMENLKHDTNCGYLIAKDLLTGIDLKVVNNE